MVGARADVAVMSPSVGDYRPRDAEHAVLDRVIDEHLDAFLSGRTRRQADGVPLPAFEEQEFYDFLTCGVLAHGSARLRCRSARSSGQKLRRRRAATTPSPGQVSRGARRGGGRSGYLS